MQTLREEEARTVVASRIVGDGWAPGDADGVARRAATSSESGGVRRGNRWRRREARAAFAVVALVAILLASGVRRWWMAPLALLAVGAFLRFARRDAWGRIWRWVRSGTG
jgi:Flp pilus assembly protein TadB